MLGQGRISWSILATFSGEIAMSLKYPEARGGFIKFHPPPRGRIYDNLAKQFIELRGSWIFKHPPPKISQFYQLDTKQKYEEKGTNCRRERVSPFESKGRKKPIRISADIRHKSAQDLPY